MIRRRDDLIFLVLSLMLHGLLVSRLPAPQAPATGTREGALRFRLQGGALAAVEESPPQLPLPREKRRKTAEVSGPHRGGVRKERTAEKRETARLVSKETGPGKSQERATPAENAEGDGKEFQVVPAEKDGDSGPEKAARRFHSMLLEQIERAKVYPGIARQRGIEGATSLRFTLLPNGEVTGIEVLSSDSCPKVLRKAALKTLKRAAPFCPVPLKMQKKEGLRMEVRMTYRLR